MSCPLPERSLNKRAFAALFAAAVLILPPISFAAENLPAETATPATKAFTVFDMPKMSEGLIAAFHALQSGRFNIAEQELRTIIKAYPSRDENYYLLARVLAMRGESAKALDMLNTAVDRGFRNATMLQKDPSLKSIRADTRFTAILEKILKAPPEKLPPKPKPRLIRGNEALVGVENTGWNGRAGLLLSEFEFANKKPATATVQNGTNPVAGLLTQWYRQGLAAGNHGDLYDNRDRGHSRLRPEDYPQLTFTRYDAAAKTTDIDYGLNATILYNAITIGNSSTAVNGSRLWRSLARLGTTLPYGANRLFLQYVNNMIYVYPAVRDYGEKWGDILTANTPYMLVSRGKSGSDRPFLNAIASILAAFKPEVKAYLTKRKMIMPTVQMLFREGQSTLRNDADYLTYKAHPPVFDALDIDLGRMVRMAQALAIKDIPPMVQLNLEKADGMRPGIDDFANLRPEELFATPGALSFAARSSAKDHHFIVSAAKTQPLNGEKLTFRWAVLRGDAKEIKITPRNADGSTVEITIPWQAPFPAPDRPDLMTSRVEIAAFVSNGKHYSAPAFVNLLFPANQVRKYNAKGRIVMIDHMDPVAEK
ncbi:MAG: tetratricopeptide repeat protein, partial [Alphaproteobacteria bacterium]